jgi:hypothetical protein
MFSIGPYWHMIIGGSSGSALLDSVELFNWKTGQQCFLKSKLPLTVSEHSGTVIDGQPIFCGGYGPNNARQKGCYAYEKSEDRWRNVSVLLHPAILRVPQHSGFPLLK